MTGERPPPTKPIKRQHIAQVVFEELAREIVSGDRIPGKPLPSERALSETYGVSRLLIRQAMHRMDAIGLVTVRQGGATIVQDPATVDHPEVSVLSLRFAPNKKELFRKLRVRQVMGSIGVLMLAHRRLQKADFDTLDEVLDSALKDNPSQISELFWTALSDATQNPFFQRDTRFWFRIVRQEVGVDPEADIPADVRGAFYRNMVADLRAETDPYLSYRPLIERLMDRIEQGDS